MIFGVAPKEFGHILMDLWSIQGFFLGWGDMCVTRLGVATIIVELLFLHVPI